MAKLSAKHQQFINKYLQCWNATEAYQSVYSCAYDTANANGSKLLANASISDEIQHRINESAMSANEVLLHLAAMARGDIDDVLTASGELDIEKARLLKKTRLIKKLSQRRILRSKDNETHEEVSTTVEMYDAQAALVHIGRHHGLFVDKQELTGKDGKDLTIRIEYVDYDIDPANSSRGQN